MSSRMSRLRVGWIPETEIVSGNNGPNGSVLNVTVILSLRWTPESYSGRYMAAREAATVKGAVVNS
jgi:hypothetical protein